MAFEAFFAETHRRPRRARLVGHAASLAVHVPPIVVFAVTWLNYDHLVASGKELPALRRVAPAIRIPIFVPGAPPGPGVGAPAAGGGEPGPVREGAPLAAGVPAHQAPAAPVVVTAANTEERPWDAPAPQELAELEAALQHGAGSGQAESGAGTGARGEAAGDGRAGAGEGARAHAAGEAGLVPGAGGGGMEVVPPPRPAPRKALQAGREVTVSSGGGGEGTDEAAAAAALPEAAGSDIGVEDGRQNLPPVYIPEHIAAYFRIDWVVPGLPDWFWRTHGSSHVVLLDVCVSIDGGVTSVAIKEGASPLIDDVLTSAVRTWRYRPRVVAGRPRPFCHVIRINYERYAQRRP